MSWRLALIFGGKEDSLFSTEADGSSFGRGDACANESRRMDMVAMAPRKVGGRIVVFESEFLVFACFFSFPLQFFTKLANMQK